MAARLPEIIVKEFVKGLNLRASDEDLANNVFTKIENWFQDEWGRLISFPGNQPFALTGASISGKIIAAKPFYHSTIGPQIVMITDLPRIYVTVISTGATTDETPAGLQLGADGVATMEQIANKLFIATGSGPVRLWTGTTPLSGTAGLTTPANAPVLTAGATLVDLANSPVVPSIRSDMTVIRQDDNHIYLTPVTSATNPAARAMYRYNKDEDDWTLLDAVPVDYIENRPYRIAGNSDSTALFHLSAINSGATGLGLIAINEYDLATENWLPNAAATTLPVNDNTRGNQTREINVGRWSDIHIPTWTNDIFVTVANTDTVGTTAGRVAVSIIQLRKVSDGVYDEIARSAMLAETAPGNGHGATWAGWNNLGNPGQAAAHASEDLNSTVTTTKITSTDVPSIVYVTITSDAGGPNPLDQTRFYSWNLQGGNSTSLETIPARVGHDADLYYMRGSSEAKIRLTSTGAPASADGALDQNRFFNTTTEVWEGIPAAATPTIWHVGAATVTGGNDFDFAVYSFYRNLTGTSTVFKKVTMTNVASDNANVSYDYTYAFQNNTTESANAPTATITTQRGRAINMTFDIDTTVGTQTLYRVLYRTQGYTPGGTAPAQFNSMLITTGPDVYRVEDNVTTAFTDPPYLDSELGDPKVIESTTPPPENASLIAIISGRMILAGFPNDAGAATNTAQVAYSNADDYETFNPAAVISLDRDADDTGITAIVAMSDNFGAIFKNNALFSLSGDPSKVNSFRRVTDKIGCVAHRTAVMCEKYVYFLSKYGVYYYDTSFVRPTSVDIDFEFTRMTDAQRKQCAGVYYNSKYFLAVSPRENATVTNNRVYEYDFKLKTWSNSAEFTRPVDTWIPLQGESLDLLIGSKSGSSSDLQTWAGNNHASAVTSILETGYMDGGTPSQDRQWRRVWVKLKMPVGASATVGWSVDDGARSGTLANTLTGTGIQEDYLRQLPREAMGKDCRITITATGIGQKELESIVLQVREYNRKRGKA